MLFNKPKPRRAFEEPKKSPFNFRNVIAVGTVLLLSATAWVSVQVLTHTSQLTLPKPPNRVVVETSRPAPTAKVPTLAPRPSEEVSPAQPVSQPLSSFRPLPSPKPAVTRPTTTRPRATQRPRPSSTPTSTPRAARTTATSPPPQVQRNYPTLGGITPRTQVVYQALRANFPTVTSYGGYRNERGSYHGTGQAIDAMVPNYATGQIIAEWARVNASRYGIIEVIWNQRIWTTQRANEGWRPMPDRGSATANHKDHVHISVR